MKYFERIKNFFREDFSDVVGIYHDGEKIFFARSTHKIEPDEVNFEISFADDIPPIEQLAEKISLTLNQRGWTNSKVGLCLNDDDVIIFRTNFENIPQSEIYSAVKTWATAQTGKNSSCDFVEIDGEIWAETLSENIVKEYISAFEKNSVNLCALTAMPNFSEPETLIKNHERAVFVAEVLSQKKSPNLISKKIGDWNFKKIFLTTAGIFLFSALIVSAKLFYDYRTAENEFNAVQKILSEQSENLVLKKDLDANISEMKKINSLLESQAEKFSKLNVLIHIGKTSNKNILLKKINATENFVQIEGTAENSDAVEKYLRRLKNSSAGNVKLENTSTADDGGINFTMKINFGG
ncbi:MAG: PilN domain-containing protein [Selenomonadaceae bacterium]|nr:PilN domain-containing protein [Selenomonadaceae bacterium]